jgi:pimeloyl-ACP methyl ester carboxylesterase
MVPHSGARRLQEALPDLELLLLDDCGHCPQLEDTERLAEALLAFAARQAPTTLA